VVGTGTRPLCWVSLEEWKRFYCDLVICIQIKVAFVRPNRSKQPNNPARLGVKPNLPESGTSAESRHGLHIAQKRV